jgi:regulator of replication initiation timing
MMTEIKKKNYIVASGDTILHNGQYYNGGDEIELSETEAEVLKKHLVQTITDKGDKKIIVQLTNENQSLVAENEELKKKLKELEKVVSAFESKKENTELKKK